MVYLEEDGYRDVEINGRRLMYWPLFGGVLDADLVINVPTLKHHSLTKMSVCLKNLMGVAGGARYLWHRFLPICLADVAACVKPRLCVVDAIRSLRMGGPDGGELANVKFLGTVAASTDMVGLDAFAAEQMGLDPAESKTLRAAQEAGLGRVDYRACNPHEVEVS